MEENRNGWVLITGAAGGIGKALVKSFSESGYRVIAVDKEPLEPEQGNVVFRHIDLRKICSDSTYADNFVDDCNEITSGVGISALINNAAIQILGGCRDISREQWKESFDVNLDAPFWLIQSFLNQLKRNGGNVVNISSIHATLTKKGFAAYATTKAALSSLTRTLAIDLADEIRINAIEPAAVATEMLSAGFVGREEEFKELERFHPIGRIAKPAEVADLAVFLCSDKASFIHGSCISAGGGIQGSLSDPA